MKIKALFLIMCEGCNLRCDYCFFEGSFKDQPSINPMSKKTAKMAIDTYAKYLDSDEPVIIFHGGEPLLNKEVIIYALEYIGAHKKLPKKIKLAINTNGTILDDEIKSCFLKYDVEVSISIDGDTHDKHRKDVNGRGTFDRALATYKELNRFGVRVGLSTTLTPDNVNEDFVKWLKKHKIGMFGFNPLLDSKYKTLKKGKEFYNKVADKMITNFEECRDAGIFEDRVMRKVKAFTKQYFYDRDCAGCGHQLSVGPNGKIGPCHAFYGMDKYFVKLTKRFNPHTNKIWKEFNNRIPLNMNQCKDCPGIGLCGGGCPFNAYVRHDSIWELDDGFCPHTLKTLEWLVWEAK